MIKITRTQLTNRLREIANTVPKFTSIQNDINPANAPAYIRSLMGIAEYHEFRHELYELANRTSHLRDYTKEFNAQVNAKYFEVNEPINRTYINPILIKYMKTEHIPFYEKPSEMFPNPWVTHCGLLFFDDLTSAQAAMTELEPHVVFDRDELRDYGRGYGVGYSLKVWDAQYKKLVESFAATIND